MILVAGSANLDFVVRAHHIPAPGETVLGQQFKTYPGGKGADQAVACARAGGASTRMLLALGQDTFAEALVNSLTAANVELNQVIAHDQPTGCACCSRQRRERDHRGARCQPVPAGRSPAEAVRLQPSADAARNPAAHRHGLCAGSQGRRCQGGAERRAQPLPSELLDALDVLVVNEGELAALVPYPVSLITNLAQLAVPCVVVTLGARGCVARLGNNFFVQAAFSVNAVDTTGAGDTFCGVLTAALARGDDITLAMCQASAAGALACTTAGAQSSIPSAGVVATFLASQATPSAEATQALRGYCGFKHEDALVWHQVNGQAQLFRSRHSRRLRALNAHLQALANSYICSIFQARSARNNHDHPTSAQGYF